ncbi:MAG: DUF4355 domain-containing protein [Clostridiaceae bacterium]
MIKNELIKLIENISDEGSIDEVLSQSDFAKSLVSSGLTLDAFKEKLTKDDSFKSFLDSEKDKHYLKAFETWKTNNLQKLLDDEIKKRYPDKDPKDTELENLRIEIENMKKEKIKEALTNKALKIATEKKLPLELIDFIVGENEEVTNKNLDLLVGIFQKHNEAIKTGLLKDNSYTPPTGDSGDLTKNPWSLEHFNLTKQAQILKENPQLAAQLKAAAKK